MSDDSGAAFPGLAGENLKAGTHIYNLGLTKREWYAGLAMQAAIAGAYLVHFEQSNEDLARHAFNMADAMLAEARK